MDFELGRNINKTNKAFAMEMKCNLLDVIFGIKAFYLFVCLTILLVYSFS